MSASDWGIKVGLPGYNVKTATSQQLVASTILPNWKCDLRPTTKNYGTVNFTIASLSSGSSVTIYQITHGYTYRPSFVDAWSYPAGTGGGASSNQTFGIGDMDGSLGAGFSLTVRVTTSTFTITGSNSSAGTLSNLAGTVRFYIFADDFQIASSF